MVTRTVYNCFLSASPGIPFQWVFPAEKQPPKLALAKNPDEASTVSVNEIRPSTRYIAGRSFTGQAGEAIGEKLAAIGDAVRKLVTRRDYHRGDWRDSCVRVCVVSVMARWTASVSASLAGLDRGVALASSCLTQAVRYY